MSANRIDEYLYSIERILMQSYGVDQARRYMMPLHWYIYTSRASATFLRLLLDSKPFVIARVLAKGGSDENVIDNVCKKIKYKRYDV